MQLQQTDVLLQGRPAPPPGEAGRWMEAWPMASGEAAAGNELTAQTTDHHHPHHHHSSLHTTTTTHHHINHHHQVYQQEKPQKEQQYNHQISTMEETLDTFTHHLTRGVESPLSKFRLVFTWVATNIAYDVDAFLQGLHTPGDVETGCTALRRRKATCSGYSDLLQRMCRCCGIECVKLQGHVKGAGYVPGQTFTPNLPNHEWNAVRLQGNWYLADVCWSAGYLQQACQTFVFKLTDHYFLPEPEVFVVDHLPLDPKWQLLDPGSERTLEEFQDSVHLKQGFFQHGISSVYPEEAVLEVTEGQAEVTLCFPYPLALTYELRHLATGEEYSKCVSFRVGSSRAEFSIRPALLGAHTFKVYGKVKDCQEDPVALTTHTLNVSVVSSTLPPWRDLRFPWGPTRHLAELGLEEEGASCSCLTPTGSSEQVYKVSFVCLDPEVSLKPVLYELTGEGRPKRCEPWRTCIAIKERQGGEERDTCRQVTITATPPSDGHYWLSVYGSMVTDQHTQERCVSNYLICAMESASHREQVVSESNSRWRHNCPSLPCPLPATLTDEQQEDNVYEEGEATTWRDHFQEKLILQRKEKHPSTTNEHEEEKDFLDSYLGLDLLAVGKLAHILFQLCAKIGQHSQKGCTRLLRYIVE